MDIKYEARRRWHSFWNDMRDNPRYRNRLIGFFLLAMLVALDLVFFLYGRTTTSVWAGLVLGLLYFWWYESTFRWLNRKLNMDVWRCRYFWWHRYLMMPLYTIAFGGAVKLLWTHMAVHNFWIWFSLAIALCQTVYLLRTLRLASNSLRIHEYYYNTARVLLKHSENLDKHATKLLTDWVDDFSKKVGQ